MIQARGVGHCGHYFWNQGRYLEIKLLFLSFSPDALALEGRRKEPMLTAFLPHCEAPFEEEEERPPSTESSSSKFLSMERVEKQGLPGCTSVKTSVFYAVLCFLLPPFPTITRIPASLA